LLLYFGDVFCAGDEELNKVLANRLLTYAFIPILCGSLVRAAAPRMPLSVSATQFGHNSSDEEEKNEEGLVSDPLGLYKNTASVGSLHSSRHSRQFLLLPQVALYCIRQSFNLLQEPLIIEPLLATLFVPAINPQIVELALGSAVPSLPQSYKSTEKFSGGPGFAAENRPSVGLLPTGSSASIDRSSTPKSPNVGYAERLPDRQTSTESTAAKLPEMIEMPSTLDTIHEEPDEEGKNSNPFRDRVLQYLRSENDVFVLLSAGVVRSVLAHGEQFPNISEITGILPPPQVQKGFFETLMPIFNISNDKVFGEGQTKYPLEMLLDLIIALRRHSILRLVTFQVLVRCILDVYSDKRVLDHTKWTAVIVSCVSQACKHVSRHCVFQIHGSLGDLILDLFSEAWELHKKPLVRLFILILII